MKKLLYAVLIVLAIYGIYRGAMATFDSIYQMGYEQGKIESDGIIFPNEYYQNEEL